MARLASKCYSSVYLYRVAGRAEEHERHSSASAELRAADYWTSVEPVLFHKNLIFQKLAVPVTQDFTRDSQKDILRQVVTANLFS
jgi:hypothetical protein